jgi:hypothetical protein
MTEYLNDLGTTTLWRTTVSWREAPTWNFDTERQILEFEGSSQDLVVFSQDKPNKLGFASISLSKVEEIALLSHFVSMQGALKKFWFPLPASLFDVMQDPEDSGQYKLLGYDFQGHERVYIERKNGDFFTKQVSYYEDEDYWYVQWEIPDGEAQRVGLLLLTRFENDSLEISHLSCDVTETKISLVELVKEYGEA